MILNIYTDGASRNNPGKSASGYSIRDEQDASITLRSIYNGVRTNNEAEYIAIITSLQDVSHDYGYDIDIVLHSDSKLAINQLNGKFKAKNPGIKRLHAEALSLLGKFRSYKLVHVPRENVHISEVDAELNRLLDGI